jgi:hypothetical protein
MDESDRIFSADQPHQFGAEAQSFGDSFCLLHQEMFERLFRIHAAVVSRRFYHLL